MIADFKSRGLRYLFEKGSTARIDSRLHRRIIVRLDALDAATRAEDMNVPGFDFHALNGFDPTRYSVHVNGPWCITFEFVGTEALRVDLEQYH